MAALGDVSTDMQVAVSWSSTEVAIPAWSDVSTAMPQEVNTPSGGGGTPNSVTFS